MEFTEDYSKQLMESEWLVKVDATNSIPYLFKFHVSREDSTCCLMITDTRRVWAEVLSAKHLVRRCRECNPDLVVDDSIFQQAAQAVFRERLLNLLGLVHSLGGISEASFDVIQSPDADLAFEIEYEGLKWRWETYVLGPKTSADLISKHLIMPLISVTHLAFYSADPVSELAENDLETVIDKVGRSARRTVEIHVKHAISKPRVATSLRRMTAMFNFCPSLPSVQFDVEKPDIDSLLSEMREMSRSPPGSLHADGQAEEPQTLKPKSKTAPKRATAASTPSPRRNSPVLTNAGALSDSATEQESDPEETQPTDTHAKFRRTTPSRHVAPTPSQSEGSKAAAAVHLDQSEPPKAIDTSSDSPKIPAKKKPKTMRAADSSSDSDVASDPRQGSSRGTPNLIDNEDGVKKGVVKTRGVRQPIKRGGRRF